MAVAARRVARLTWLEAIADEDHGAPHQQMRLVLMVLALAMNSAGVTDARFVPSHATLGRRCLMDPSVVRRRLAAAKDSGWISWQLERRARGQNWRRVVYAATIPEVYPTARLRARREDWQSSPSFEVRTEVPRGEDRGAEKVRTGSPTIPPKKSLQESLRADAPAQEARAPRQSHGPEPLRLPASLQKRFDRIHERDRERLAAERDGS